MDLCECEWDADSVHLAYRGLQIEQRHPYQEHSYRIWNKESASSILVDQVREPPKGTEAHAYTYRAHDVLPLIAVNVRVVGVVGFD
jgi:hypothetical protein